jgi:glycosyltransferase involved in cell wall biosynthesis
VIVIPSYNRARSVGAAIDSALAQDYPDVRLIVVDDGSLDGTAAVLAAYREDPRVRVIVRERNGGVMAAKNTGLDALPEDCAYFGILDSDDTLVPEAVTTLVRGFRQAGGPTSQVFGWCADAQSGVPTGTMKAGRCGPVTYQDVLCERFTGEFWQLVRRDLLGDLRFDERAGAKEAMVWWPMMRQASAFLVDHVVRVYDRSGTDRVNRPAFTEAGARRKMWGVAALLERVGDDMRATCPGSFATTSLECAKWAALAGERAHGWRAWREAYRAERSWRLLRVGALLLGPAPLMRTAYRWVYGRAS